MGRPHRIDHPGLRHHIFNRGIARRTMLEYVADIRFMLALVARHVRAERIELLAYSFLTTHFHFAIRSLTGELSAVMQQVMNRYVRRFNIERKRDGSLCRGRFGSVPVRTDHHCGCLVRYIDQNAVDARIPHEGELYPFGSEYWYRSVKRPRWLSTSWVDKRMGNPPPEKRLEVYGQTVGRKLTAGELEVLQRRIEHPVDGPDEWDSLVAAAAPQVFEWMRRKAKLADGTQPGRPYVGAIEIDRILREEEARCGAWVLRGGNRQPLDGWMLLRMGLLRDLAGLRHSDIAARCGCSAQIPLRRIRRHARLLLEDEVYAQRAAELAVRCLRNGP